MSHAEPSIHLCESTIRWAAVAGSPNASGFKSWHLTILWPFFIIAAKYLRRIHFAPRSPGGSCRRLLRKSNTLCPRMMTSTTYNPDWSQSNTQASTCPHCQCNNTSKRYAYVLPPHILCEEPYKACDCYVSMSDRSMIHIKVGCGWMNAIVAEWMHAAVGTDPSSEMWTKTLCNAVGTDPSCIAQKS